jgi:hypothetical protein
VEVMSFRTRPESIDRELSTIAIPIIFIALPKLIRPSSSNLTNANLVLAKDIRPEHAIKRNEIKA